MKINEKLCVVDTVQGMYMRQLLQQLTQSIQKLLVEKMNMERYFKNIHLFL